MQLQQLVFLGREAVTLIIDNVEIYALCTKQGGENCKKSAAAEVESAAALFIAF